MPFTRRGMETIKKSLDFVARNKHSYVGIEHLLLVFTEPDSATSVTNHQGLGEICDTIRQIVNNQIEIGDFDGGRNVPQTTAAKQTLLDSMALAQTLGQIGVNPEHMFLAVLGLGSEPLVKQIHANDNIDIDHLRNLLTIASELDKYMLPIPPNPDG
jgi:ATP-dependent Clp protease ATP-binding subunit ClpA